MKLSESNKTIVAILVLAALAVGFWMLLLSPKREEASKLASQADELRASLSASQLQVSEAEAAKREFPGDYRRWWCSARPSRATRKPPRCWSS